MEIWAQLIAKLQWKASILLEVKSSPHCAQIFILILASVNIKPWLCPSLPSQGKQSSSSSQISWAKIARSLATRLFSTPVFCSCVNRDGRPRRFSHGQ